MNTAVQRQFAAFLDGFKQVVSSPIVFDMDPQELELVICGTKEMDFDALRKNCRYKNYKPTDPQIVNFWNIVSQFTDEQKRNLLIFATGNDRVPVGGLGNLNFVIAKYGDTERFPTASTCFNLLNLPPYPSYQVMKDKLTFAIENARGFGLA